MTHSPYELVTYTAMLGKSSWGFQPPVGRRNYGYLKYAVPKLLGFKKVEPSPGASSYSLHYFAPLPV